MKTEQPDDDAAPRAAEHEPAEHEPAEPAEHEPAEPTGPDARGAARASKRTRAPRGPSARLRRSVRRERRVLAALTLLAPAALFVASDFARRAHDLVTFDRMHTLGYWAGVGQSLVFWSILLLVASRRRGLTAALAGVLFAGLYGLVFGVQSAFFGVYNLYLSIDGQIHSQSFALSLVGHLPFSRPLVLLHVALGALAGVGLLALGRRHLRTGRYTHWLFLPVIPALFYAITKIPVSYRRIAASPPDALYFHGLWSVWRELEGETNDSPDLRVQLRSPEPVPKLTPSGPGPRNVVLILQESQRGDVTCIEYDPDCELATPFTNVAAPDRFPLLQLRALDSTTAISISTIWSGMLPAESAEVLHSAPLVWEYAKAAGYHTTYWTSQHAMFGNIRLYIQDLPLDSHFSSTHLDRQSDPDVGASDAALVDRAISEWGSLREPFFVVLHPSNVHFPYVYDARYAPYQPASMDKAPEKNHEFFNYYKDVVYLSDLAMGRFVDHVRSTEVGERTVIFYTSDHGESFREHWQLGHTSALYDEEVRVPGWIDAPPGVLTPDEEASLRKARDELVWHVDLLPTLLDLMGVWDDPALTPFRARMWGHPLTRPERTTAPLPMTNCSWVWECAFRNWGMMQGPLKLEAREWDHEYHCFNVLDDPEEQRNLGEAACGPLAELARGWFGGMPVEIPPGRPNVSWGKK